MGRKRKGDVHGVLVVDKPRGPTSHDVVAWARRALGTPAVGHAGTLDPMATGVLVLGVGEGTKLLRWLTVDDKEYRATVALGAETDSLDADGEIVERAPVPALDLEAVREVARRFEGTITQRPPIYSAIKVDGEPLHARARRGEDVEAPTREVTVRRLEIFSVNADALELEVEASKGFYVRSLGGDLARALDTRGHLVALRRLRSGGFVLADAVDGETLRRAAERDAPDEAARAEVRAGLLDLAAACRDMPRVSLDARGETDAAHGRAISLRHAEGAESIAEGVEPVALLDASGNLCAIGRRTDRDVRVVRGVRL
ncbi:MAG: tRNA pseudouridine(55) synthase TruB [Sandaracinaceae bacterium]